MREVKPLPGDDIGRFCRTLYNLAFEGEEVTAEFNGVRVTMKKEELNKK